MKVQVRFCIWWYRNCKEEYLKSRIRISVLLDIIIQLWDEMSDMHITVTWNYLNNLRYSISYFLSVWMRFNTSSSLTQKLTELITYCNARFAKYFIKILLLFFLHKIHRNKIAFISCWWITSFLVYCNKSLVQWIVTKFKSYYF